MYVQNTHDYPHHDGGGGGVHVDKLLQLILIGIPVVVNASNLGWHELILSLSNIEDNLGVCVVAGVIVVTGHLLSEVGGTALLLIIIIIIITIITD